MTVAQHHDPPRPTTSTAMPQTRRQAPTRQSSKVEPLLVVYRVGSVVCLGTQQQLEPGWIDEFVPPAVRYKAGGDSAWTRACCLLVTGPAVTDRLLQPRAPAEEHVVRVVPGQREAAAKGTDQVGMLQPVLELGTLHLVVSVAEALDRLAKYRVMVRSFSRVQHSSLAARAVALPCSSSPGWASRSAPSSRWAGKLVAVWAGCGWLLHRHAHLDMVMLCHVPQVIAASALVISEARGLLEMAEPAWDYAAYHSMWAITAGDCELEGRLKALEVKLTTAAEDCELDGHAQVRKAKVDACNMLYCWAQQQLGQAAGMLASAAGTAATNS
ncbi:hypothetical protein COO60DRAFT_1461571 [Scenedesmus sp. NREL 46B-D3]|nr:hypothetical protein COO60DRAFT_1461571 [Scenedesmus sp. NREL 46B-D3]